MKENTPMEKEETQQEKLKDDNSDTPLILPPDGGWGWCVVFASFMCNAIVDGIIFSFGIFLTELTRTFGTTKAQTAWVGSLQAGFYLMIGPVVSALANTFGCRPVTIAGSIIASIAFGLSYFATSIPYLVISMGLIGGIGFGFIFLPAIVTVGFYFDQRRALATGIAVCGSGVGAFALAPLCRILISMYGWQGALLILSGLTLNCCFFGAFFREIEPVRKSTITEEPTKPLLLRIKEARDMLQNWDSEESVGDSLLLGQKGPNGFESHWKNSTVDDTQVPDSTRSKSFADHSSGGSNTESTISQTGSNSSPPPSYSEVVSSDMLPCLRPNQYNLMARRSYCRERSPNKVPLRKGSCQPEMLRPFYRQDILFSASLIRLPEFRSQPDMKHYRTSVTHIPQQDGLEDSRWCCSPAMRDTFRQMLDLSLLSSPTFLLLSTSGFLTLAGFFVPFTYLIDRSVELGIDIADATFLLSIIGITNTIGRVCSGWLSDRPNVNALVINNCALVVGGLATSFSPFIHTYPFLVAYCAVFGFSIACFAALRSIIVVELLGLERLTNAFGLLLLFQGIASIIGSPVLGQCYDITGNYDMSFYIAGALLTASGIMCFPLPLICRWEKRRKNRTQSIPPSIVVTDSGISV